MRQAAVQVAGGSGDKIKYKTNRPNWPLRPNFNNAKTQDTIFIILLALLAIVLC
jgi:hypothetical protein